MSPDLPPADPTPDRPPATDPRRRRATDPRRRRRGLSALVALLAVAAIAAGIVTRMIPGLPARQPGGTHAQVPEEIVADGLAARAEAEALAHVVLQLDDWNQCPWPDCTTPWGHVPEFTLFDDGRVVYMDGDPADRSRWFVRAAQPAPEDMALLLDQIDALVRGPAPHLAEGDPCPAANGCPGGLIVRVRRDGVLQTYAGNGDSSADAWSALTGAAALLHGWSSEMSVGLPKTMVVVPSGATEQWQRDDPPSTWLGIPVTEMPEALDRYMVNDLVLTSMQNMGFVGQPTPFAFDVLAPDAMTRLQEFALIDDTALYRHDGWWLKTEEIPMPTVDGGDASMPLVTRLVFVPWIYPDVDVAAMLDMFREARRNAVAARAAADALALAGLPTDIALTGTAIHDILATAPAPTPTPFPPAPAVTWSDGRPTLPNARGIQTWMHWFRDPQDRQALARLRGAGFQWFKQRFAWADLQVDKDGAIEWVHSDRYIGAVHDVGGQVMVQLAVPPAWALTPEGSAPFDLAAWRAFDEAFATRYRGEVAAYEIMNEPNLAREWGGPPDPAAYARVLDAAYLAIKAVDPQAVVISAGLAPTGDRMPEAMGDDTFLNALYSAMEQSSGGYFDALGVHAAGFRAPPGISPDEAAANPNLGGDRTFTFRRVEDLRAIMVEDGDAAKPVVVTEFGWTVDPRPDSKYHWAEVTPEQRAMHIRDAFGWVPEEFGWSEWIGPMFLFSAADRAWTPDDEAFWWAVADADGNVDGAVREALGLAGESD